MGDEAAHEQRGEPREREARERGEQPRERAERGEPRGEPRERGEQPRERAERGEPRGEPRERGEQPRERAERGEPRGGGQGIPRDLPKFNGSDALDFEDWDERFQSFIVLSGEEDEERILRLFRLALSKEAAQMTRGLDRDEAVELLKSHFGLSDATAVPTAQAAIRDRHWRTGDTILTYASEILMHNRRLRQRRHSYTEQELKNMAIANFPRALKNIAASTLEDGSGFLQWCQALARIVQTSKIELTPKQTQHALYSHPRSSNGKGANGTHNPKKLSEIVCYRCRATGHKMMHCETSWDDCKQHHEKASSGESATVAQTPITTQEPAGHALVAAGDAAVADNGASRHIVSSEDNLTNVTRFNEQDAPRVRVAGGSSIAATAEGDKQIVVLTTAGDTHSLQLRRCLVLPNGVELVSIDQLLREGQATRFTQTTLEAHLHLPDGSDLPLQKSAGLVWIRHHIDSAMAAISLKTLHTRLAHASRDKLLQLIKTHPDLKMHKVNDDMDDVCHTCEKTKATRQPMNRASTDHSGREPGDLLVADMAGPLRTTGSGHRYVLIIKDAASNVTNVLLLKTKSATSVSEAFEQFFKEQASMRPEGALAITRGRTILQTDNDPTFLSGVVTSTLATHGVTIRTSGPDTSTRQGKAEAAVDRLFKDTRAMLSGSRAPATMWGHAIQHAAYCYNRLPSTTLGGKTPLEVLTGKHGDVARLRTFGCKAFVWRDKEHRQGKLDDPAQAAIYLGESPHGEGHIVLVGAHTRTSTHCTFDEAAPGFTTEHNPDETIEATAPPTPPDSTAEATPATRDEPEEMEDEEDSPTTHTHTHTTATRGNIFQQLQGHEIFGLALLDEEATDLEPTLREAMQGPNRDKWMEAVEDEFTGLEQRGTWTEVPESNVPRGAQVLDMKIALKVKLDPTTGDQTRLKARACIRGFRQILPDGVTTSAPVVIGSSVKTILSLASALDLKVTTIDFTQAYLNADLNVPVYVRPPPEVAARFKTGHVLHVKKALYGLSESGRRWYECLRDALKDMGLKQSFHDPCVFYRRDSKGTILVCTHVDDALIAGDPKNIDELKERIRATFKITESPQMDSYLGWHIDKNGDGSYNITQEMKIYRCLEATGLLNCPTAPTPMTPNSKTKHDDDDTPLDHNEFDLYRRALGQLRHIAVTYRSDIAATLNHLSAHALEPHRKHLRQLKHLLRYLKGTAHMPLVLGKDKNIELSAYSDANWKSSEARGKNITGGIYRLCGGTIDTESHRQDCVASSTCHAEMIALSTIAKGVIHLRALLNELGHPQNTTTIYTDSEACDAIADNFGTTKKTRHVDAAHFLFQEYQEKGLIDVTYVPGTDQWADILTKPLPKGKFIRCRDFLLG
jgi:hypothetical protein